MIMQAKVFSAMGVWTSLEPQLTTPTTSPSLLGRRGAQSSRPCIDSKMDLRAFTGRGQGGPCLTDAAQ
jgi:hypothetical protein